MTDNVGMCAYLLGLGVDIGCLNRNGHSAYHKAATKGSMSVLRWLFLEGGLGGDGARKYTAADVDGNTPSSYARDEGHAEAAAWLAALDEDRIDADGNVVPRPPVGGEVVNLGGLD
mmetsp:Transcript_31154/g.98921  ORF Transcript_31154/g.98921 Transcript_31154/m.98921 type:complete len:116 (-) Transcript_31154:167-514(-)